VTNPWIPWRSGETPVAIVVQRAGEAEGSIDRSTPRDPFLTTPPRFGIRPAAINGSITRQSAPSMPNRITRPAEPEDEVPSSFPLAHPAATERASRHPRRRIGTGEEGGWRARIAAIISAASRGSVTCLDGGTTVPRRLQRGKDFDRATVRGA
jgi:hypothetical protein